jgi:SAM-dependent methyltransferase
MLGVRRVRATAAVGCRTTLLRRAHSSVGHPAAVAAYSDEARAARYDALRPSYPSELLAEAVALAPATGTLVDLGAGAGRLTRALLALPTVRHQGTPTTRDILPVEPAAAMRGAFTAEGVACVEGSGDAIPAESGSCAAVVCGEAFHWMASAATLQEIHRVLCADGKALARLRAELPLSKTVISCQDRLGTTIGRKLKKPVLCIEAGVLVLLWNTRDPHASGFATQLENGVISPLYSQGGGSSTPRQQQQGGAWCLKR